MYEIATKAMRGAFTYKDKAESKSEATDANAVESSPPANLQRGEILENNPGTSGNGEPCYYCGELCDSFAGNPGKWPIILCHKDAPGVSKAHHSACISSRLELVMSEVAAVEAMAMALNDSKEMENQGFSFNERLAKICFKALKDGEYVR